MTEQEKPARDTFDTIKQILRTDLRLGADREIPDDAPLFESELDLDSLDSLLLVSAIEKSFGVKIPNDEIDRAAFENITTLARFVERRRASAASGAETDDEV